MNNNIIVTLVVTVSGLQSDNAVSRTRRRSAHRVGALGSIPKVSLVLKLEGVEQGQL